MTMKVQTGLVESWARRGRLGKPSARFNELFIYTSRLESVRIRVS